MLPPPPRLICALPPRILVLEFSPSYVKSVLCYNKSI